MKIKSFFSLCSFLFLLLPLFSGNNRISLKVGINHVLKYGSESDYIPGTNDFPITPSHNNLMTGLSYTRIFLDRYGIQADFTSHSSVPLKLTDPSDGDEIQIDGAGHLTVTFNLLCYLLKSAVKPYMLAGAGLDFLTNTKEQNVISRYGYPVTIEPPDKKADLCFNLGAGMDYSLGKRLGFNLEFRYLITMGQNNINNLNLAAGILLRF